MSEPSNIDRDGVHAYRPGPDSELPKAAGEELRAVFLPDVRRYWSDQAALAALGAAAVLLVMPMLGKGSQIWAAILGVFLAVALRALLVKSEVFARRWQLTDRRLIGPQGRQVVLSDLATVRRLFGDVQLVSRSGQKHLIKHLADTQGVMDTILAARDAGQADAGQSTDTRTPTDLGETA
jgi:hypothetical protein